MSQFGNDASSVQQLDAGADGLAACALPAADVEQGGAAVRGLIQCHMCGVWLRSRQTLTDHIRGKHLSIYNYHCKYCGLAFKWRSALRNHQLNCSASRNETINSRSIMVLHCPKFWDGWLVGWGLTVLLTQSRSYRACKFVGIPWVIPRVYPRGI